MRIEALEYRAAHGKHQEAMQARARRERGVHASEARFSPRMQPWKPLDPPNYCLGFDWQVPYPTLSLDLCPAPGSNVSAGRRTVLTWHIILRTGSGMTEVIPHPSLTV